MKKIMNLLCKSFLIIFEKINPDLAYWLNIKRLAWLGININAERKYASFISLDCDFDSSNYGLISIGKRVTISKKVIILAHDFSIKQGLRSLGENLNAFFLKPVSIGNDVFIGANVIILPGTTIGDNVIIGAGTVVKGRVDNNTVYIGNPGRAICSVTEWASRHKELNDYSNHGECKHVVLD